MDIEDLATILDKCKSVVPSSLKEVVERGLCSSCGACEGLLGKDKARMVPGKNGRLRPALVTLDLEEERRVLKVCPGAHVAAPQKILGTTKPTTLHPIVGPVFSVRKGYATDKKVRFEAAAAGGLTALSIYLLESKRVRFILHISPSRLPHKDVRARLSWDRHSVLAGSGSRYAPSAPLSSINDVLDLNMPFAFIGKPCDINALCNLAEIDKRVNILCKYKLTISCGSYADPSAYYNWLSSHDIAPQDVQEFRYRGHGCPGWSPYARTSSGKEVQMDYVDFWYSPISTLTYQWRCKVCPDFLGFQADITVMDCWPNGPPEHHLRITEKRRHERDGWVLLVARTELGDALLDLAAENNASQALSLKPACIDDVLNTQPHQVTRAVGLWARRLVHTQYKIPQPSLSQEGIKLMVGAAFDSTCLMAAINPDSVTMGSVSQKSHSNKHKSRENAASDHSISVTTKMLSRKRDETLKLLELSDTRAYDDRMLEFHMRNYEGCLKRIKRGDPNENVPVYKTNNNNDNAKL